jgi:hypothetical protein
VEANGREWVIEFDAMWGLCRWYQVVFCAWKNLAGLYGTLYLKSFYVDDLCTSASSPGRGHSSYHRPF